MCKNTSEAISIHAKNVEIGGGGGKREGGSGEGRRRGAQGVQETSGNGGGEGGLPVVDMANGANVHVRLVPGEDSVGVPS